MLVVAGIKSRHLTAHWNPYGSPSCLCETLKPYSFVPNDFEDQDQAPGKTARKRALTKNLVYQKELKAGEVEVNIRSL